MNSASVYDTFLMALVETADSIQGVDLKYVEIKDSHVNSRVRY